MHKLLIFLVCLAIPINFISCSNKIIEKTSGTDNISSNNAKYNNPEHNQKEIDKNNCNIIISGFSNKDKSAIEDIKSLFCKNICDTHDLNSEIQSVFDFINGDIVSYESIIVEDVGGGKRDGVIYDLHSFPQIKGIITDTGNEYLIIIANQLIYPDNTDYEGISRITVHHKTCENEIYDEMESITIGEVLDII